MFNKLSTILMLLGYGTTVYGSCHECQSNLAMCHDERRFTMCAEGISSTEMLECPSGYICTAEDQICVQTNDENPVQPTCDVSCDVCNSYANSFACVGEMTYAFCFGADVPNYEATGICPEGYVCNFNSPEVCTSAADVYPSCYKGSSSGPSTLAPTTVPTSESTITVDWSSTGSTELSTDSSSGTVTMSTTTTTEASTSTTASSTQTPTEAPATESTVSTSVSTSTEVSSTTQKPRDVSTFCKDQQKTGFYRAEGDQSCREYFYCYLLSGQYLGVKYTCPTSTFFDNETKRCQNKRPADC